MIVIFVKSLDDELFKVARPLAPLSKALSKSRAMA